MAWKRLGAIAPSSATLTPIYVVPVDKQATISTIHICNQASEASFRLAVLESGEDADDASAADYLYYDEAIREKRGFAITTGITLAEGEGLYAYSSHGQLSFSAFGVEIDEDS